MNEQHIQNNQQSACPNCGYCPHCGRGAAPLYPLYPQRPLFTPNYVGVVTSGTKTIGYYEPSTTTILNPNAQITYTSGGGS